MVVNGKRLNCPTHWHELKTRHYQRIIKEWDTDKDIADRDYFKLFNILTDSKFDAFEDTIENQVKIETSVAWIVLEEFRFSKQVPEYLEVNGRRAHIEKNLRTLSIGANIKARQALDSGFLLVDDKGKLVNCDCYSMLVAIYLQPELMPTDKGGFNWANAQKLEKIISEMPITEIYPIGFFLLNHVYKYGQKRGRGWKQILTNLGNKIRKTLQDWLSFKDLYHSRTWL